MAAIPTDVEPLVLATLGRKIIKKIYAPDNETITHSAHDLVKRLVRLYLRLEQSPRTQIPNIGFGVKPPVSLVGWHECRSGHARVVCKEPETAGSAMAAGILTGDRATSRHEDHDCFSRRPL